MRYAHIFCGWSKRLKPNESSRAPLRCMASRYRKIFRPAPFDCDLELPGLKGEGCISWLLLAIARQAAGSNPQTNQHVIVRMATLRPSVKPARLGPVEMLRQRATSPTANVEREGKLRNNCIYDQQKEKLS
jgi:hypothetical protein